VLRLLRTLAPLIAIVLVMWCIFLFVREEPAVTAAPIAGRQPVAGGTTPGREATVGFASDVSSDTPRATSDDRNADER
jgi:hypothetical protein